MTQSHKDLVAGVLDLAGRVQDDKQLTALIRRKFAIKCTTGYSLNALVDFSLDDPIEIIKRLMIGSEGTFGFVSEATYNCVPEWPHKVSPCLCHIWPCACGMRIHDQQEVMYTNSITKQLCRRHCCCMRSGLARLE